MAKRFTDTKKWRNEWFRNLSTKAKLTWIYLCDECEYYGVIKIDYGLASFQLGFTVDAEFLTSNLGEKIHMIDQEKILILNFFEFQYGENKETWSAKVKAREKLENLGFTIENNKIVVPKKKDDTTVVPQWGDSTSTVLIKDYININIRGSVRGGYDFDLVYQFYPRKEGKKKGIEICRREIKSNEDYESLKLAVNNYAEHLKRTKAEPKFIKHFSTFMGSWRDWIDHQAGSVVDYSSHVVEKKLKPMGFTEAEMEWA